MNQNTKVQNWFKNTINEYNEFEKLKKWSVKVFKNYEVLPSKKEFKKRFGFFRREGLSKSIRPEQITPQKTQDFSKILKYVRARLEHSEIVFLKRNFLHFLDYKEEDLDCVVEFFKKCRFDTTISLKSFVQNYKEWKEDSLSVKNLRSPYNESNGYFPLIENDYYKSFMLMSTEALKKEGKEMHHCVGDRTLGPKGGKFEVKKDKPIEYILSIKKKSNDRLLPYVTISTKIIGGKEVSVGQVRGVSNCRVEEPPYTLKGGLLEILFLDSIAELCKKHNSLLPKHPINFFEDISANGKGEYGIKYFGNESIVDYYLLAKSKNNKGFNKEFNERDLSFFLETLSACPDGFEKDKLLSDLLRNLKAKLSLSIVNNVFIATRDRGMSKVNNFLKNILDDVRNKRGDKLRAEGFERLSNCPVTRVLSGLGVPPEGLNESDLLNVKEYIINSTKENTLEFIDNCYNTKLKQQLVDCLLSSKFQTLNLEYIVEESNDESLISSILKGCLLYNNNSNTYARLAYLIMSGKKRGYYDELIKSIENHNYPVPKLCDFIIDKDAREHYMNSSEGKMTPIQENFVPDYMNYV